jgi:hypothetical protein
MTRDFYPGSTFFPVPDPGSGYRCKKSPDPGSTTLKEGYTYSPGNFWTKKRKELYLFTLSAFVLQNYNRLRYKTNL